MRAESDYFHGWTRVVSFRLVVFIIPQKVCDQFIYLELQIFGVICNRYNHTEQEEAREIDRARVAN